MSHLAITAPLNQNQYPSTSLNEVLGVSIVPASIIDISFPPTEATIEENLSTPTPLSPLHSGYTVFKNYLHKSLRISTVKNITKSYLVFKVIDNILKLTTFIQKCVYLYGVLKR